jgi:RecA-family ATPase
VFVLRRGEESAPPRFPAQADLLEAALAQAGAKLVVIDPIRAFLDQGIATANGHSVRRALPPLARLADRYACAILLVRHLTKSGSARPLYRGGGSIGILGACRSAWLIAPDPEAPERRVLA